MFEERMLLDEGVRLELRFRSPSDYRLAGLRGERTLAELRSGGAYEFRSVEKLRYDFERALEDALRRS